MKRVYPSDVIVGGTVGLAGFYVGLSKGVTVLLAMLAVAASIGVTYLYHRWRAKGA